MNNRYRSDRTEVGWSVVDDKKDRCVARCISYEDAWEIAIAMNLLDTHKQEVDT